MAPRPPWPAATWISTSSTNMFGTAGGYRRLLELFNRVHADDAAARAMIFELHAPVDFRKQRVVLAEAHVQARPELPAALPHQNRAAGDDVAVVALDAQPLRIAVTPVARRAL